MFVKILDFLLITGAVHGFIFNIATLFSRKKVEKPIIYLNLIVFFLSLNNLQAWLIDHDFSIPIYYFKNLLVPWYMMILPMFYVFLLHYLRIEKKLWTFLIISSALFVLELLTRSGVIIYSYYQDEETAAQVMRTYNNVEEIVNAGYSIFIFIKAILVLFKYERLYEFILQFDDIAWIKRFIYLGTVVIFFWLIAIFMNNYFSAVIEPPYTYYPLRLSSSILLYWIGYQGFFRYVVVEDRIMLRKNLSEHKDLKLTLDPSDPLLSQSEASEEVNKQETAFFKVHEYVIENERYLDPSLSLESLASELDMSANQLSALINGSTPHNFSDYINKFRVEQAKNLLKDSEFDRYTIVSIGLECGFNSKSTFYAAFRKFTEQTPTEYRKALSS